MSEKVLGLPSKLAPSVGLVGLEVSTIGLAQEIKAMN